MAIKTKQSLQFNSIFQHLQQLSNKDRQREWESERKLNFKIFICFVRMDVIEICVSQLRIEAGVTPPMNVNVDTLFCSPCELGILFTIDSTANKKKVSKFTGGKTPA